MEKERERRREEIERGISGVWEEGKGRREEKGEMGVRGKRTRMRRKTGRGWKSEKGGIEGRGSRE